MERVPDEPRQLTHQDEYPQTDALGPGDIRWLQSEFRATRELSVALNGATNTRLDEHHQRISALEGDKEESHRKRKRLSITALITAVLTLGSGVFTWMGSHPR